MTAYAQLNTSKRILMGPGPSDAHPRVLQAMATPLIGHLDPEFVEIMDEVKMMVQKTFQTENYLTFVVSAPGSAGMETCLVNLLEPGDEALICIHGVFGGRMAEIADRCGAKVIKVEAPWGEPIDPDQVKLALEHCNPKLVAIVHAETSTGVLQPLEEISKMAHDAGALFMVDAVTSYCGVPLKVDEWGIDAIYSGTQKCLSAPPGLSPVSFSDRAVKALENRKTKVQSWFLDLSLVKNYWGGAKRAYHHTAPVSAVFALREALRIVLEEGLENRFERHRKNHQLLASKMKELGMEFLVDPAFRLPNLNAVKIPEGVDDAMVRNKLLNDYNIEIGGGLGKFAGKVWRIGLMGESSTANHVNMLVSALQEIMFPGQFQNKKPESMSAFN
jgi:alanine-glyoxylate transaminase/serine-glyoxylate transaminase/serine-pyruvate transaminase